MRTHRPDNDPRKLAERMLRDEIVNFCAADRLSREEVHHRIRDMTDAREDEGVRIVNPLR